MPLVESIDEHNDRMNREADRSWNQSRGALRATSQELVVREEIRHPAPLPVGVDHPLERDPADFRRSLAIRGENRTTLVVWLKDALKSGIDFGRIHFVKKSTCDLGANCKNPAHFTKDTLFKPGAEKICGMLGVTPTFPNLGRYEEAALAGTEILTIILRCQILAVNGSVVSEGVGARALAQDYGDLNKALKMAQKSAHIDATLRMAGLSEVFSHPETPPAADKRQDEDEYPRVLGGQFKGQYWADVPGTYIEALLASDKAPKALKDAARAELERRPKQPSTDDFDDDIPF